MLTWLDEWCDGMRLRRRELLAEEGRSADEYCRSDGLAAREATAQAFATEERLREAGRDIPLPVKFIATLAPYFADLTSAKVKCAQLTRELAEELRGAQPTRESMDASRRWLHEFASFYIDIPSGAVVLGDSIDLRAVFVEPWIIDLWEPEPDGTTEVEVYYFCAIVAPCGKYGWRHVIWHEDRSVVNPDNELHEPDGGKGEPMPGFDTLLEAAGVPISDFLDDVERLAYLVMDCARDFTLVHSEAIPHMPIDNPRRRAGHGGGVEKRFSLFRVERLRPKPLAQPTLTDLGPGNAEIATTAERRAWRLGYRIDVQGHYRNQRVGKRGEGRLKRIWVESYQKGPMEALPLHRMMRLTGNADQAGETQQAR